MSNHHVNNNLNLEIVDNNDKIAHVGVVCIPPRTTITKCILVSFPSLGCFDHFCLTLT